MYDNEINYSVQMQFVKIYILLGTFFWNTGWYFWVLKVFDEPLR